MSGTYTDPQGVVYTYSGSTASVTGFTGGAIGVVIPSSITVSSTTYTVTSIGEGAFNNKALTTITIPASVTTIGDYAFLFSGSLASVTFGAGSLLQTIGNYAFYSAGLISINIPASVTTIGDYAFSGTPTSIVVTFGGTSIPSLDNPFGYPANTTKQGTALYQPGTSSAGITTLQTYFTIVQQASSPLVCFLEGSKILTNKGYKPIQELKKGDLVKTLSSGYKKIDMIGYKNMWNPASEERIKDQLYVYKKKNMEEVFEDLVLTGCHSVLIDRFETSEKREKVRKLLGGIFITEKKARLPACLDERAEIYKSEGLHAIYHVALENEVYTNSYGIYANGLLVESCSQEYLKELSGMMLKE